MKMKISMIGGGSYSWTYGLYSTFLDNPFYDKETELCLYDINEKALNDVYAFCKYYNDRYPEKAITLTKTLSEDEALEGSDFVVIAISILVSTAVFSVWPVYHPILRFLAHLAMLPVIVGVSYEFNRWAGRHDGPVTRFFTAPGLWLQNFTTFEPDDSMIEVGIRALELVLPEEKGADAW